MKLKLALLALVAGFSLAANAQTETRQEVKAEAKAANQAGAIGHGEVNAPQPKAAKSTMTRAEGRAKAKAANKSDAVAHGNAVAEPDPKATKSSMSRAQARDKARAANKSGQVQTGEGGSK